MWNDDEKRWERWEMAETMNNNSCRENTCRLEDEGDWSKRRE